MQRRQSSSTSILLWQERFSFMSQNQMIKSVTPWTKVEGNEECVTLWFNLLRWPSYTSEWLDRIETVQDLISPQLQDRQAKIKWNKLQVASTARITGDIRQHLCSWLAPSNLVEMQRLGKHRTGCGCDAHPTAESFFWYKPSWLLHEEWPKNFGILLSHSLANRSVFSEGG